MERPTEGLPKESPSRGAFGWSETSAVAPARSGIATDELPPGDGRLHITDEDFSALVEHVLIAGRKIVDGCGLKTFVRFDEKRAYALTFDLLAALASEAGKGDPRYDLVLGGIQ